MHCSGLLGKRCSCGVYHDTEGTLDEPIGPSNVLATCFWIFFAFVAGLSMAWLIQTYPLVTP